MKNFDVSYSLRGTISVRANTEEEAKRKLLNSDMVETEELLDGVRVNMMDAGNDAVTIDDVCEAEEY